MSFDLGNILLGFFTTFFQVLTNAIFSPIETLWVDIDIAIQTFPLLQNFTNVINTYFIPSISWFTNLIPPLTWSAIKLHIDFMILIYGVVFTLHLILKPLKIIKKLPLA